MKDSPKQFMQRFLGFSMGPVVSAIISFITVPITTYFVIPDDFGKASMYTTVFTISSLFIYLGMDQAFVREFNSESNKKALFLNALSIPMIFSIFLGIIYVIFYKEMSLLMLGSIERYVMLILAISLPFAIVNRFNLLLLRMQEKARIYSFLNIMTKILNIIILIPYLLFIDKSFRGIINANFFNLVIMCLIELIFVKDFWINKFKLDTKLLNRLFKYGLPLIPAAVIGWLLNSMDKLAMRHWSNFSEIGLYSLAFRIVAVITIVQSAFATFWSPTAFRWYEEGVENERYIKVSNILMCFMNFIFIFLILFRNIIIKIMSPKYLQASSIVPFLLLYPILYTVSEGTTLGISFSRKTGYNIIISAVAAAVNYVLNYMLVPKYGAVGASVATGLCYVVFFWMRTLISRKLWFKFKIKFYVLNTIFMVLLAGLDVLYNNIYINLVISMVILFINRKEIVDIYKYIRIFLKKKNPEETKCL